jgi:glycosyltransferase involved in cell wall biosynthesis
VNIWRDVKETGAGIVVGLDTRQLAAAISKVLSDKTEAVAMGAQGRIAAEKGYAWPSIIKQFNQVYRELINANQAGHCQLAS